MTSRFGSVALALISGIALGIVGYAAYRGDLRWTPPAEAELAAREAQPEVAAAPPKQAAPAKPSPLPKLPVSLNHYENRRGRGYIVQIHNQSQKHLAVLIELENPTLEQEQNAAVQLAPGEIREIGEAQGWTFVSGETIRVRQKGYQTASLTIP